MEDAFPAYRPLAWESEEANGKVRDVAILGDGFLIGEGRGGVVSVSACSSSVWLRGGGGAKGERRGDASCSAVRSRMLRRGRP